MMKAKCLFAVFFLFPFISSAQDSTLYLGDLKIRAQVKEPLKITIGIKTGIGITSVPSIALSIKNQTDGNIRNALIPENYTVSGVAYPSSFYPSFTNFGTTIDVKFSKHLSAQGELFISTKVVNTNYSYNFYSTNLTTFKWNEKLLFNSIELPLMLKAFTSKDRLNPSVGLGIAPSLMIGNRRIITVKEYSGTEAQSTLLQSNNIYTHNHHQKISASPIGLNVLFSAGNQIYLNKRMSLNIEGRVSVNLVSCAIKDQLNIAKGKFSNFYVTAGFLYNLNFEHNYFKPNRSLEKIQRETLYLINSKKFTYNHFLFITEYLKWNLNLQGKKEKNLADHQKTESFFLGLKYLKSLKKNIGVTGTLKAGIIKAKWREDSSNYLSAPNQMLKGVDVMLGFFYSIKLSERLLFYPSIVSEFFIDNSFPCYFFSFKQGNAFNFRLKNNQLIEMELFLAYSPTNYLLENFNNDYYNTVCLNNFSLGIELGYSFLNFRKENK